MGFYNNLCPGCMNEVGNNTKCPYCGFDLQSEQSSPFLAYGTTVAAKYVVGDILEQNDEGVTYLGLDTVTNNCVRIREFLPAILCSREQNEEKVQIGENFDITYKKYKNEFIDMWHKIMRLNHLECMISVLDVFESNNTAYAIAEADANQTLADYLEEKNGTLTVPEIKEKIYPAIDAIEACNKLGIVHGALSPDTLFLCGNGTFKPWGFSISEIRKTEGTLSPDIRPGYAAIEQYGNELKLSDATDVYGFACVLYKCITGTVPIDAEIRSKEDTLTIPAAFARELPGNVLNALIESLQVMPEDRTKDITEFKKTLAKEIAPMGDMEKTALVDPLTTIDATEAVKAAENQKSKPVIIGNTEIPVLNKESGAASKSNTTATVILSVSIILVMIIFFACLALTGIVSFNIGGNSTAKVIEVPDFSNASKSDAAINQFATKYGFHITLVPESSDTVPQDIIFKQSIAAGTKAGYGSELTLTYSKGASVVTLPNFVGMTFTETVYYLGKLNLSYNIVEKDNDGSQTAGDVSTMSPAAGSSVYENTEITIEVWGDPPASSGGDKTGESTGSQVTSSSSILDSIFGSLSDSVSGLGDTIQSFLG